jgi:VanZ family protein
VFQSITPTRRVWLWSYAPFIVWIGIIFLMSSPGASAENTSRIIGPILHYFFPAISDASEDLVHFYVRKTAHFTEYGILAMLGVRAFFSMSGAWYRLRWLMPVVVVAAVASLDEFNQSFEPSRTSSPYDVLLDISGGVTAVVLCFGVYYLWRFRQGSRR